MPAKFCAACGGPLKYEFVEGKQRPRCQQCNRMHYEQLIIGAGALVETGSGVLLLRRNCEPFKGCWGLPAGHVESDEEPASAAVRETEEETGLVVRSNGLVDAYYFDDHPKGCGVFLVYRCEIVGGRLSETTEAKTPTFFVRDDLPDELAGGGHSKAILSWKRAV
jgi:ADP-ribose pyrophosphatase YjhB (NUDIX family)